MISAALSRNHLRSAIAGCCLATLALLATGASAFAKPGDLDLSFGQRGRALTPAVFGTGWNTAWKSVSLDLASAPDRSIVIAGGATYASDFDDPSIPAFVSRYRPDGRPDRHFAPNGLAAIGELNQRPFAPNDMAVDSDGRILLAGASETGLGINRTSLAAVARYLPDGELDSSFADGGVLITDFHLPSPVPGSTESAPQVRVHSLISESQGGIVLSVSRAASTGICYSAGAKTGIHPRNIHQSYLVRLTPEGVLDSTFGTAGIAIQPNVFEIDQLLPDGRASGLGFMGESQAECGAGGGVVGRVSPSGVPDPSFGSGGQQPVAQAPPRHQIAFDHRGRILLLWGAPPPLYSFPGVTIVTRLLGNGSADKSFGRQGTAVVQPGGFYSLAVDARDRILLAGAEAGKIALLRLKPNGRPDRRFGRRGRVTTKFGRDIHASALDVLIDGRSHALVAGVFHNLRTANSGFTLSRYRLGSPRSSSRR